MIPFPGESVGIDLAIEGGDDFDLYFSIRRRGGISSPATRTLAGEQWRAWVYPGSQTYLEDSGTDVVVSWVVEVVSGSGSITASAGLDPDFGDPDAAAPVNLGTHAISGATTLVLPTTLTAANVMAGDSMMLVLDATGSIEVQQVKLRVWPSAGVLGGWGELQPSFSTTPALPAISGAFVTRTTVNGPTGDYETAWDAAISLLNSGAAGTGEGPHPLTGVGFGTAAVSGVVWRTAAPQTSPSIIMSSAVSGTNASVQALPLGMIVLLAGADAAGVYPIADGLVDGVDFTRPPTEVAGDDAALAQQLGVAGYEWFNPVATVHLPPYTDEDPLEAGPSVTSDTTSVNPVSADGIERNMIDGPAVVTQSADDTLTPVPLTAADRWVVVYASHSMITQPIPYPGLEPFAGDRGWQWDYTLHFGQGTPGATFAPMKVAIVMPPYRVWNPSAPPVDVEEPLRLRQRSDGLALGSTAVRGIGSRQHSTRVRGYL